MNRFSRLLSISALTALAAFSAHADEADGSQHALQFSSTRSVADVKAEAAMPVQISNGGTGFIGVTQSNVSPAEVRAEAAAALRSGRISRGEIGLM